LFSYCFCRCLPVDWSPFTSDTRIHCWLLAAIVSAAAMPDDILVYIAQFCTLPTWGALLLVYVTRCPPLNNKCFCVWCFSFLFPLCGLISFFVEVRTLSLCFWCSCPHVVHMVADGCVFRLTSTCTRV